VPLTDPFFRDRASYPGTEGGPFELLVRYGERLETLPAPLFALVLAGIAAVCALWADRLVAVLLYSFLLGDWLLLRLLPVAQRSFGPAKPSALILAILRLPATFLPLPWFLLAQGIGSLLALEGFWLEPQRLTVARQHLASPKLGSGFSLKLIHFGDLHLERLTHREHRLLETIQAERPDILVFTGDLLSYSTVEDEESWEQARWFLSNLAAPLGVYAVDGSPPVDRPEIVDEIRRGLPIRWLRGEVVTIDHQGNRIDILGVPCSHRPHVDTPKVEGLADQAASTFSVLLYHSPDLAPMVSELGIDLQLSGHTHGGQVRLPIFGALYTSSLYGKKFEMGRYQLGAMTLYVTRGIGMEGKAAPRVRFLCPPEVTTWQIEGRGPA
jgi:predicted MPP superfamily phosphohydrolase